MSPGRLYDELLCLLRSPNQSKTSWGRLWIGALESPLAAIWLTVLVTLPRRLIALEPSCLCHSLYPGSIVDSLPLFVQIEAWARF